MTLTSELVVVQTNGIRFPFLVLSDFLAGMWPRASRVGLKPDFQGICIQDHQVIPFPQYFQHLHYNIVPNMYKKPY